MPAATVDTAAPREPSSPPTRPPAFVNCYVCGKQFGSRSVSLHEPRCLQRWRAANAALPAAQRTAEPQRPGDSSQSPSKASEAASETAEPALTSSWPRSNGRLRAVLEAQQSPRVSRPRTATLKKPRVLDAEKKTELDMSTTRCNELLQLVAQNRQRRERAASEERGGRPQTIKLTQPSSKDLNVPNIDYRPAAVISPEGRSKAAKTTTKLSRRLPNFTRALEELFHAPRTKAGVPRPCMSCGKPENPERFHSHPAEPAAEPPRRAKRPSKKRMSIQRPVAIRYKPAACSSAPQPPIVDPVAQRKQQLEEEQRQRQARLRAEYLKKEEKSRKAREDAMRKKLAFALAKQQRVANGGLAPPRQACYVCGRLFSTSCLVSHQQQCLEGWRRENETLPEEQRQPEPQPPAAGQANNAEGTSSQPAPQPDDQPATDQQPELVACRHCGRTFFPDRVQLHEKTCQPRDGDAAAREPPSQVAPPAVCYICKARFPPDQLVGHELECVSHWRAQNAIIAERMVLLPAQQPPAQQLPVQPSQQTGAQPPQQTGTQPSQQQQPQPPQQTGTQTSQQTGTQLSQHQQPQPPQQTGTQLSHQQQPQELQMQTPTAAEITTELSKVPESAAALPAGPVEQLEGQLDAMVDAAWQSHLSELVPCTNCGRTFFPDRLEKHTKNCKVLPKLK